MKNKGWVKLWREQYDSWISKKPFCDGYAWSYLYSRANHKKGVVNFRNEYIEIKRGELLTSKLKLQEIFGWTRRHLDNFLKALENDEMLTYRTTNRYIVITIVNYNIYQGDDRQNDIQNGKQTTNRRPTDDKRPYHKQELKEQIHKEGGEKKLFLDSIYLTTDEYKKLINEYGKKDIEKQIENLQRYIARTGKKYNSHYLTIKAWIRKDMKYGLKNEEFDNELPESNTMVDLRKELDI